MPHSSVLINVSTGDKYMAMLIKISPGIKLKK
jgi:hypothetical protein